MRPAALAGPLLGAVMSMPAAVHAAPCAAALCVTTIEVDGQPATQARDVLLRDPTASADRKATVSTATTLADGSVIETPTRPRVRLTLTTRNGNTLTLQPGARLQVETAGEHGERYTHWLGEVRFAVTRALGFFEVAHEKFLAAVKGTEFGVSVDPQQGEIRYDWVHGEVRIDHELQVSVSGRPKRTVAVDDADADPGDDGKAGSAVVVERQLLSQATRQLRYRLDPAAYLKVFRNFGDAEQYFTDQLAADRRSGDPQRLLLGLSGLGSVLAMIGKPAAAADVLAQALALSAEQKDAQREAELARDLGRLYRDLGDYPKAMATMQRSLAIEEARSPAGGSVGLAHAHIALGRVAGYAGDPRAWVASVERALAIWKVLDPQEKSIGIAAAYKNLADAAWAAGARERAMQLYRTTQELKRRAAGNQMNWGIANGYRDIGLHAIEMGQQQAGIEALKQALAGRIQLFGDRHPTIANSHDDLGRAYESGGDLTRSLASYQQALEMRLALFPNGIHPRIAGSYEALARVSRAAGRSADADRFAAQATAVRSRLAR